MIFRDRPTCKGVLFGYLDGDGNWFAHPRGDLPCPTCQDSEGEAAGRGLYLSVAEITIIADSLWASGHKMLSGMFHEERVTRRELTHRSNPGKGGA